jgi:hypothetical protein
MRTQADDDDDLIVSMRKNQSNSRFQNLFSELAPES